MILVNSTAGTFHPILYLESPMPGNTQPSETARRYKSKFHHTTGFATREEAIESAKELVPKIKEHFVLYDEPRLDFDCSPEWDGEGIPASVIIYDDDTSTVVM